MLDAPAAQRFEALLDIRKASEQPFVRPVGQLLSQVMVGRQQFPDIRESAGDDVEQVTVPTRRYVLFELRHPEPDLALNLAGVGEQDAVHNPHQCRLAGPVTSDQADPLATLDVEIAMIEYRVGAEGDGNVLQLQHTGYAGLKRGLGPDPVGPWGPARPGGDPHKKGAPRGAPSSWIAWIRTT